MTTTTSTPRGKPLTPRPSSKSNLPALGRQGTKKVATSAKKTPAKPNASILSFFKKVDSPMVSDDSMFLGQSNGEDEMRLRENGNGLDGSMDDLYGEDEVVITSENVDGRFNEHGGANKRRKVANEMEIEDSQATMLTDYVAEEVKGDTAEGTVDEATKVGEEESTVLRRNPSRGAMAKKPRYTGPFLPDSDSEEEVVDVPKKEKRVSAERESAVADKAIAIPETKPVEEEQRVSPPSEDAVKPLMFKCLKRVPIARAQARWEALQPDSSSPSISSGQNTPITDDSKTMEEEPEPVTAGKKAAPSIPELKKETTSIDEWAGFDELEDFPDEFADDGEEFMERKWMEEQAMLEAAEATAEGNDEVIKLFDNEEITAACPICNGSLEGISPDDATRHVNGCLDGNPIPIPAPVKKESSEPKLMPAGASSRFMRKAAQPRPGQASPFDFGNGDGSSSAFSKLMSGHAEDAAWASAAAAEHAARGKPAYQRTCPFYKIMPGFFICVDAFRYGAVQGCNAYFLSHFHTDHYSGLTSTWCHGPIYCSKVTGNLVKQQLHVDPEYVVPLEFDKPFEVPGTEGVSVTMIPANHCPGSSLFLYEKTVGRGRNPKVQRVLHCGDFRACPAHIEHPLLMPNTVDSITGKTKQQKIDVCYLDTTYLNPRYAFPPQEEVIKACADMCISLRKERAEESDAWVTAKRERASGMTKFITTNPSATTPSTTSETKPRGRLLIIVGTYSIGKERICMGIARALDCKIYAPPSKTRICLALEDPELASRLTPHPLEAQIHMQALMEIRPETLSSYLDTYRPHFSRIIAFRPSGWNYKPPIGRGIEAATVENILRGKSWRSGFGLEDLVRAAARGSTREVMCYGVPYSEHSSFRELTMFCCALRIERVVPTVNVGSKKGRERMRGWVERWMAERRRCEGGVVQVGSGEGDVRW